MFRILCKCVPFWLLMTGLWGPDVAGNLWGQDAIPPRIIKINPLSLGVGTLNVKMENRLSKRFSGQLGLYIGAPRLKVAADSVKNGIQYFFIGVTPELRYYISFNRFANPKGLFVAAFCKYSFVKERYLIPLEDPNRATPQPGVVFLTRQVASLGFLLGYQFVSAERLAVDLFAGPQYSTAATKTQIVCNGCDGDERALQKPGLLFDGIQLRAGVALGYAF